MVTVVDRVSVIYFIPAVHLASITQPLAASQVVAAFDGRRSFGAGRQKVPYATTRTPPPG